MIDYDAGTWGVAFIFRCKGSVFPKALAIAVPHTAITVLIHIYLLGEFDGNPLNGVEFLWAGFTSVLSFLLVFRNNQAYTRFWEGASLIYQVRGEWFNAVSALFAFCNREKEAEPQVRLFQHNLVRLASLLYCSALQQVCDLGDDCLEVLEVLEFEGMEQGALAFLKASDDRCEVILQWIQRLIVEANDTCTLSIAPPLLTRAFQELSRGLVSVNNARKIQDIPFPFPYAQLIMCMLLFHWCSTPLIIAMYVERMAVAATGSFVVTFFVWCLVYINMELDQPFGEDANDLSLAKLQRDFNKSLVQLMHPSAQRVPDYEDAPIPVNTKGPRRSCASFLARSSMTQAFQKVPVDDKAELFMDVVERIYNAFVYSRNSASRIPQRLKMGMLMLSESGTEPESAGDHEEVVQPMSTLGTGPSLHMMSTKGFFQGDPDSDRQAQPMGATSTGRPVKMMTSEGFFQGDPDSDWQAQPMGATGTGRPMHMMSTGGFFQGDPDSDRQMGASSSGFQVGRCPTCSQRCSLQAAGDRSTARSSSALLADRATTPAGDGGEAARQVGRCPTRSQRCPLQAADDRSPVRSSSALLVDRATTPTVLPPLAPLAGDDGEAGSALPVAARASTFGQMGRGQSTTSLRSTAPCLSRYGSGVSVDASASGVSVGNVPIPSAPVAFSEVGQAQLAALLARPGPVPWSGEHAGVADGPNASAGNDFQGDPSDAERPEPDTMAEEFQAAPQEDDQRSWDPTRPGRMHM